MEFIEQTHQGYAAFRGYQTWYRVTGNLDSGKPPWSSSMGVQAVPMTIWTLSRTWLPVAMR